MNEQEKKNRRVGLLTSAGIHVLIFVLLFFVIAWRAPDPPLPEFGIELNFGLDDQGSGDIQPETPVGEDGESTKTETAVEPAASNPTEVTEDLKEPVVDKVIEQAVSKTESPVTAKEKQQTTATQVTKKKESAPVKTEATVPAKEIPAVVAPAETPKKGEPGSQGDNVAKTGDKGSAEGKLDAKALYGTPGGGGGGTGMNLQMSGWAWAEQLQLPELPKNEESGRVLFEIECDVNGDITRVTTLERTLSPKAEQLIKDFIRKNSLIRTAGGDVPAVSKGKIVFSLKMN